MTSYFTSRIAPPSDEIRFLHGVASCGLIGWRTSCAATRGGVGANQAGFSRRRLHESRMTARLRASPRNTPRETTVQPIPPVGSASSGDPSPADQPRVDPRKPDAPGGRERAAASLSTGFLTRNTEQQYSRSTPRRYRTLGPRLGIGCLNEVARLRGARTADPGGREFETDIGQS